MFRKEIKDSIIEKLKRSPLTEHAFSIKFAETEADELVHIRYVLRESFRFSVHRHIPRGFEVTRAPGNHLLGDETGIVETVSDMLLQLQIWLEAVASEDEIDPNIDSDVGKLKEAFFRELGRHVKNENVHFSREEVDDLASRVDALEQKLEQIMRDQKRSTEDVQSIKKLMKEAKKDAGAMTKRKWLIVGGGKLLNALLTVATSKDGKKLIVDSVRGLLGDGKTP